MTETSVRTETSVHVRPVRAGGVPHPIVEADIIPAARYTSREFAEVERDKLWPRVWQVACRLEELPAAGDFTEYTIADQSILVVRQEGGAVRAFYNACRHRGTTLGVGAGSFRGGQISCRFHGWRWNLDGSNSYVHHKGRFRADCVSDDELRLREVRAEVAHGMVWVNLDPDAPPLADALSGIEPTLDATGLDQMRVSWWRTTVLPANWKAAIEAYMEAYHVMATHPEFAMWGVDDEVKVVSSYRLTPEGHSWYAIPIGQRREKEPVQDGAPSSAQFMANMHRVLWEGARGQITERQLQIQEDLLESGVPDSDFIKEFFAAVYTEAATTGTPLRPPSPEQTSHAFLFPNVSFVQELGNSLMFRARPNGDDPHSCIFDFWSLVTPPAGAEITRPTPDASIDELWFLQQDVGNITRQQAGLRTRGHDASRLSLEYEPMISNFHQVLDRVMSG